MLTLYKIRDDLAEAVELLLGGHIDETAFSDTLSGGLAEDAERKIEDYVYAIKNLQATEAAIAGEIKKLQGKKTGVSNAIALMRQAILSFMKVAGMTHASAGIFSASLRKAGGQVPLVLSKEVAEGDYSNIPEDEFTLFFKSNPAPDKEMIRQALADGQELSWAKLEGKEVTLNIS